MTSSSHHAPVFPVSRDVTSVFPQGIYSLVSTRKLRPRDALSHPVKKKVQHER